MEVKGTVKNYGQERTPIAAPDMTMSTMDTQLVKLSQLADIAVSSPEGDRLGRARDVLADLNSGRLSYVVLEVEPSECGPGCVLVPWAAVKWNQERDCLMLDVTRDRISKAPRFDDRAVDVWSGERQSEARRYFGIEPSWEKPENYTG